MRYFIYAAISCVFCIIFAKTFVADFDRVASDSMSPTLIPGDFVFACKLFPSIAVGKPVIFHLPLDAAAYNSYENGVSFIKRIKALSGDTLSVKEDTLFINGRSTQLPSARTAELFGDSMFVIPRKGTILELSPENEKIWHPIIVREGHEIILKNRIIFIDGNPAVKYALTQNYCFVVGDNYANSYDSRLWGLLPESAAYGVPILIYWSLSDNNDVRFGRLGIVR